MKVTGLNIFLCPECGIEMDNLTTQSHYGSAIRFEQCPKCGGLWFESLEPYQVKLGEVDLVDRINGETLKASTSLADRYYCCPKDKTPLEIFTDPNFPRDLQLQSCPACRGFWFNRGEFRAFEKERVRKMLKNGSGTDILPAPDAPKKDEFEERVDRLLQSHKGEGTYESLGKAAEFLSQPVSTSRGFDTMSGSVAGGDVAKIVFAILRVLMAVLLKR